ncbi:hypothetical protein BH24BAC1_BH24BAC1_31820 [soil metagenome]
MATSAGTLPSPPRHNSGGVRYLALAEKPLAAGIDPYHQLIDRNPADNLTSVESL